MTYVEQFDGGLTGFISGLYDYCREQLRAAKRRPQILAIAEEFRHRRLVLPRETLELFTRYQTSLDNQLFKALKALREAQEWRLKTIDADADDGAAADALAA